MRASSWSTAMARRLAQKGCCLALCRNGARPARSGGEPGGYARRLGHRATKTPPGVPPRKASRNNVPSEIRHAAVSARAP